MVITLICSMCVVNYECKEWEQIVSEPQRVEDTEKTDEIIKDEETKVESTTETIEQDVESKIETGANSSTIMPPNYSNCDVPANNTIKSYMDYRTITSKISNQYKLQKALAYTGNYGIRMVNGRYCVALGSYYTTTIGQYVDIELQNGNVINGILADCKADEHTNSTNQMHPDGSVVEFIVDTESLDDTVKIMGDVSYVNGWDSKIVNIKVYDKVEDF